MTPDAPEFPTKPTTPLSPLPFHPLEPSNIPVLRNQIDPIFNMTSTHIGTMDSTIATALNAIAPDQTVDNGVVGDNDDNSFSDPYDEDDKPTENGTAKVTAGSTEVDDDYAKTFDSDAEGDSSKQDVSNADVDQKLQSPPAPVSFITDNTPFATSVSAPSLVFPAGTDLSPSHSYSFPTAVTAGDAPVAVDRSAAPAAIETSQSQPQSKSYEAVSNGEIDIQQLLDNITANAALNASNSANATPTSANSSIPNFPTGSSGLPAHASLPPRPQVTQNPSMHQTYPAQGDIRKYHAGSPNFQPTPANTYRPLGVPQSIVAAGAPGTSTDPRNVLPPPPSASFHSVSSAGPAPPPPMNYVPYTEGHRLPAKDAPASAIVSSNLSDDSEYSWSPNVQKLYDDFLADERMYVSEGLWDRFPVGSRLFIGNLPSELVAKRDLFNAFYKYGRLAQISIKQAYGFVQFHTVADCQNALKREQGAEIRGRKMHLEISKPQKNTRSAGANTHTAAPLPARRSRSPDYMRGGVDRAIRGGQIVSRTDGYDRYDARAGVSPRDAEFRRARDDYRPGRSPSPTRGSYRGREDYGSSRNWDYYDGRERRRSRSRSPPYGRRDSGRYRERSISPRVRDNDEDADLQIPRRDPRDVPEVQIILMDELDRGFVGWVEGDLRVRGIRTEVMLLSPRISLAAVIRRQILEGVLAVAQLTRRSQDISKIPLQVFDRTGGANNVRFDEYQDLEPKIAAELVVREKQKQAASSQSTYVQPQLAAAQSYQQPPTATAASAPNLANIVGQLDNATLQKLLGTLTAPPTQAAPTPNPSIDLAGILGLVQQQQQQQQVLQQSVYQQQTQPSNGYAPVTSSGNLSSMLGNMTQQTRAQGQSAQQVQNIMAQLAKFRQ